LCFARVNGLDRYGLDPRAIDKGGDLVLHDCPFV